VVFDPGHVLGRNQIADPIVSPGDFLKNPKGESDARFARAVPANQQGGRKSPDWKLEIFQAAEIVDVKSINHGGQLGYRERVVFVRWSGPRGTSPARIVHP
jgi:hypothetical protein